MKMKYLRAVPKKIKKKAQRLKKLDRCFYCRCKGKMTKDHYIPKSKGGTFCVPACLECNQRKRDMMPYEFMALTE